MTVYADCEAILTVPDQPAVGSRRSEAPGEALMKTNTKRYRVTKVLTERDLAMSELGDRASCCGVRLSCEQYRPCDTKKHEWAWVGTCCGTKRWVIYGCKNCFCHRWVGPEGVSWPEE
jgi:hypothetical protein